MSMPDLFKVNTEDLTTAGQAILSETEALQEQTDMLLEQIQSSCLELPPTFYTIMEANFPIWKAFLERSSVERKRIGTLLELTAQVVEENEHRIVVLLQNPDV